MSNLKGAPRDARGRLLPRGSDAPKSAKRKSKSKAKARSKRGGSGLATRNAAMSKATRGGHVIAGQSARLELAKPRGKSVKARLAAVEENVRRVGGLAVHVADRVVRVEKVIVGAGLLKASASSKSRKGGA